MRGRSRVREERGGALTLVGFWLVCLLASGALVVNLRSLFQGQVDAEHAAEAAALARASAYLNCTARSVVDSAKQRALRSAARRHLLGVLIDTGTVQTEATLHKAAEVRVEVIPDEYKVRVWVMEPCGPLKRPTAMPFASSPQPNRTSGDGDGWSRNRAVASKTGIASVGPLSIIHRIPSILLTPKSPMLLD